MKKIILLFVCFISMSTFSQREWENVTISRNGCHNQVRLKIERRVSLSDKDRYEVRAIFENTQSTYPVSLRFKFDKEGSWSGITIPINGKEKIEYFGGYSLNEKINFKIEARRYVGLKIKHLSRVESYAKCGEGANEILLRDRNKGIRKQRKENKEDSNSKNNTNPTVNTSTSDNYNNDTSNTNSYNTNTSNNNNSYSNTSTNTESIYQKRQRLAEEKAEKKRKLQQQRTNEVNELIKRQEKEIEKNKAYSTGVQNSFSQAFDSEGNFNTGTFINTLPEPTTKTQAYSNLALAGASILAGIIKDVNSESSYDREIANRRIQLKNGKGRYNSNNNKTGHWTYFYMGTTAPKSSGSYKNGKKHGIWEFYDDQDYSTVMYKKMNQVIVYNNGELLKKYRAKNADADYTHEVGLLSIKKTFIGTRGNYIYVKDKEIKYGLWEKYNLFGVNISSGYYNLKGFKTGMWTHGYEYQKNGVWYTRNYKLLRKSNYSKGIINGKQYTYHRSGIIKSESIFKNGLIINLKSYDKSGKLIFNKKIDHKYNSLNYKANSILKYNNLVDNLNTFYLLESLSIDVDNIVYDVFEKTNFKFLKTLILDGYGKSKLPNGLLKLKKLEELYFGSYQMDTISNTIYNLNNLNNLKKLSLYNCGIKKISNNIINLNHLNSLSIINNKLQTLPDSISSLKKLETLNLNRNKLISLPNTIGNLINLNLISLFENNLTTLPEGFFNLNKLEVIGLGKNKLKILSNNFVKLRSLKRLYLQNNNLISLPENIGQLKSLEVLDIRYNNIQKLPLSIKNLTKLKELHLDEVLKKSSKKILKELKKRNKNLSISYSYRY